MSVEIIKNPVILGLFAGVLTYGYLWWSNSDDKKKIKGKKQKKEISLIIPAIIMCIVWFLSYGYFEYGNDQSHEKSISGDFKPIKGGVSSQSSGNDDIRSFSLINKGLNIPSKLPDVFIGTF